MLSLSILKVLFQDLSDTSLFSKTFNSNLSKQNLKEDLETMKDNPFNWKPLPFVMR